MKRERTVLVNFRLPPQLIKRLDEYAKRVAQKTGMPMNRTDVVRMILNRGLKQAAQRVVELEK